MAAALRRDGGAAVEPFSRLRVVKDRVRRVDGVLRRAVPQLGGLPMPHDPCPDLGVTVHCRDPEVRWAGWTVRTWDRHWFGRRTKSSRARVAPGKTETAEQVPARPATGNAARPSRAAATRSALGGSVTGGSAAVDVQDLS